MKKRIFSLLLALCLLSTGLIAAAADTPAPTIYATEKGQALALLPVRMDDHTAISALEADQALKLAEAAMEKECTSIAVAAVTTEEDVTKTVTYLPDSLFSFYLGDRLLVTTDLATVELPKESCRELGKADGDVKFTLEQTDAALILTITADKEIVTDLSGGLILKIQGREPVALTGSGTVPLTSGETEEEAPIAFTDMPTAPWAVEAITYVTGKNLMTGTGNGKFSPEAPTTRAMIWAILGRLSGADVDGGAPWYAKAQAWATAEGISDGSDPTGVITREQLAVMLHRYAQSQAIDVTVGEDTNILSYQDAFDVSEYAYSALQWACGAGILTGHNGHLNPQGSAKRVEAAAMLMRFLNQ